MCDTVVEFQGTVDPFLDLFVNVIDRFAQQKLRILVYLAQDVFVERFQVRWAAKSHVEPPVAPEAGDVGMEACDVVERRPKGLVDGRAALVDVDKGTWARLGHEEPSRRQAPRLHQKLVELLAVQRYPWPGFDGVVNVHDDNVVRAVVLLQEPLCVANYELEPWVVERALAPLLQLGAGKIDNDFIYINHNALFHALVPQDLPCRRHLAPPPNVHALWVRVSQHGRVHEGFVVHVLIVLGRLGLVVQY